MFKTIVLFLSLALTLLLASCGADSKAEQQTGVTPAKDGVKKVTYVTMPENTAIAVTLVDSIDTDVQTSGDGFRARLAGPIVVNGQTLFADGADARGILNNVVESGRLKTPAELSFSLTSVKDRSDRWVDIGTNTIVEKKASHTNREVALIGGGAIVGGVIGKIIDRKGSTEIGAAAGAAVGTGLSAATGKQDIFHGAGTEVTFFSSESTKIALR